MKTILFIGAAILLAVIGAGIGRALVTSESTAVAMGQPTLSTATVALTRVDLSQAPTATRAPSTAPTANATFGPGSMLGPSHPLESSATGEPNVTGGPSETGAPTATPAFDAREEPGVNATAPARETEATAAPGSSSNATSVPSSARRIYAGIAIDGVPWDMGKLAAWEKNVAGKAAAIVHYWIFWKQNGVYQELNPALLDRIRSRGSIPMITWAPEEAGAGTNQPDFQLSAIISGRHDAYIEQWARAAKAWGRPFFLRWAHEADGDWFPWGEDANGNHRGEYAQAWRHIHDLFRREGATNVTWVWCPNVEFPDSPRSSYASLYPGNDYVDWICVDGYNWGNDFPANGGWASFHQIFRYAYDTITDVAPNKPMMLGEWASSEAGGSKAAWIRDALDVQIPIHFPHVKAVVWYNLTAGPVDWRIESSRESIAAWRAVMVSNVYRGAEYGALRSSPIGAP